MNRAVWMVFGLLLSVAAHSQQSFIGDIQGHTMRFTKVSFKYYMKYDSYGQLKLA